MDRALNLSDMHELLHDTLLITEEVKEVLRKNCDEAAFVLKPWKMKTVVEKEKDESICNCKKVASENEAEEIAAGIDRAITLAQDLREKVKLNVASRKKSLKKNPIENIYSSDPTSASDRKKVLQKNVASRKVNVTKTIDNKNSAVPKSDKMTSVSMGKTMPLISIDGAKQSSTTNEIQSKPSPAKIASRSRKERNFILENKLSVKKVIPPNKPQASERDFNNSPGSSKKSIAAATELSSLIHKMAQQSMGGALILSSDINKTKCPLHEDKTRQSLQERITTIDVAKVFQYFNIPNEIVKVLKTYHAFLNTGINNLVNIKKGKYKESVDIFLREFEAANAIIRNHSQQKSRLINVATDSISSFGNIFHENLNPIQINDIKNAIAESEIVLKRYNIDNIKEPIIERRSCNLSLTEGWMSNGVWNIFCMEHFENFSKAYNIRYNSKRQLLSLYETIQKLQRTEYLNTLIRIMLRDVIPAVKSTIDPTSAEYARAYKTMFVLQQGLNPEMPVLVRTDN